MSWYRSGRRAFLALAIANIALYALSIAALDFYQGGSTTSMRYMIIALPFFCVLLPDFRAFAYRKTFLLLFAVSAANMFVLAATSTMYGSEFPLSESAYPDFWRGEVAFNPLLARLGVAGARSGIHGRGCIRPRAWVAAPDGPDEPSPSRNPLTGRSAA